MREVLEKKMTGLLIGLRSGTKSVTEVLPTLNKLRSYYPLIAEDYDRKYISIINQRKTLA